MYPPYKFGSDPRHFCSCPTTLYILFRLFKECVLRVNVRIIQSGAEQGSVDLADFHIYCSVFHADSRGAIRFSYKLSYAGLR